MKKKKIIMIILSILIASIYMEKLKVNPMEELNIIAGIGYDIHKELNGDVKYSIPFSIYEFKKRKKRGHGITTEETSYQSSRIIKGEASTVGETRQERELKSGKPSLLGSERIILISEETATYGLQNIINILFANAKINDRGNVAVCKGKAEDILAFKVEGYSSSSDFIEGMVRHGANYNFLFSEYTLLTMYDKLNSEGESLVLPYIEVMDKNISLTGMAIFKGNKMAYVLPMEEGKIMNMLREKSGKGILSLQESPGKYINYDAVVKKKVKCDKKEGKYEFNIDLYFQGDIKANTLYKTLTKGSEKEFEDLMAKKIEKLCNAFLNKIKNVYKVDCLDLAMHAVAKYGRNSGVDWCKEVSNSEIKVKVKVKIDKIGIGQY